MEAAIRSAFRDAGAQGVAISTNSFLPNQGSKRRVITMFHGYDLHLVLRALTTEFNSIQLKK